MQTFFTLFVNVLALLVTCVIPFVYVLKKGGFKRGIFFAWQLQILWGGVCLVVPLILIPINESTKQFAVNVFPEMFALPLLFALILGWLWGIIISGLAIGVRWLYMKSNPKTSHQ